MLANQPLEPFNTSMTETKKFLENSNFPTVIKADNLASGKGVYICNNIKDFH